MLHLRESKKWIRTPAGWHAANVLYYKVPYPPRHMSVLESVFFLVYRERKVQELLATKALVTGLALASQRTKVDPVIEEYEKYADEMLPFLTRGTEDKETVDAKQALHDFVKRKAIIDLRPMYKAQVANAMRKLNSNKNRVRVMSAATPGEVPPTTPATGRGEPNG